MSALNNTFRTTAEVSAIKKNNVAPRNFKNYVLADEIAWLNNIHAGLDKKWQNDSYRNSFKEADYEDNPEFYNTITDWATNKFSPILGNFNISSFFFYESPTPASATDSTVHVDIWDDEKIVDKTILIPLKIEPQVRTHTIIFDQHYYHYGAAYAGQVGNKQKFGPTVIIPDNYEMVEGFRPLKKFDREIYFAHLTHKPYANFYGLSVNQVIKWDIGNAIVFDRTQLHCCDHYFNIDVRSWFAIWTNRGSINGT